MFLMYRVENMELRKFVTINEKMYAVDFEITLKNKIYIAAIRELKQKLVAEEDFQANENEFKIKYNGNYYTTLRISSYLKFTVSTKKKNVNWNYRTSDGVVTFNKNEELKKQIEAVTKEIKIDFEYDQMVFVKSA
jgi:hypothetical protein